LSQRRRGLPALTPIVRIDFFDAHDHVVPALAQCVLKQLGHALYQRRLLGARDRLVAPRKLDSHQWHGNDRGRIDGPTDSDVFSAFMS
jgi:hypothetical protein